MKIKDVILESPDDIKAATYLNSNVDDGMLGAAIRETQNIHLQSIIGSNLLYRLQELVFNAIENREDNIEESGNTAYKELLDDYVQPYMEAKVQAVLPLMITYKTRNLGVSKSSDDNIGYTGLEEVYAVQRRYNTVADRFATMLSKFLCARKEDFPELSQGDCGCGPYIPPIIGKRFANVPLNLGSVKNSCCKQ